MEHSEAVSVTHLRARLTAIEISLDLRGDGTFPGLPFDLSPLGELRVCLVAGFALTAQLERVVSAIGRALPARLPARLHAVPFAARARANSAQPPIAVQPMGALIRLQSTLVRAIEPGLAHPELTNDGIPRHMDDAAAAFVRDFVASKALPTLEGPFISAELLPVKFIANGITVYRLGVSGLPEAVLKHWEYPRNADHLSKP